MMCHNALILLSLLVADDVNMFMLLLCVCEVNSIVVVAFFCLAVFVPILASAPKHVNKRASAHARAFW